MSCWRQGDEGIRPYLFIVGKSGSGKNTLAEALEEQGFKLVLSLTSRPQRDSEKENPTHIHVSREYIETLHAQNGLCMFTEYNGEVYGVPTRDLANTDMAIIDPDGLVAMDMSVLPQDRRAVILYLSAPDDVRIIRMRERGDSEEAIRKRLEYDEEAFQCMSEHAANVGVILVNTTAPVQECVAAVLKNLVRKGLMLPEWAPDQQMKRWKYGCFE